MLEGSGDLDFSMPPRKQEPVSGYTLPKFNDLQHYAIGGSATLVRNPSWDAQTDSLRGAYPNRIEIDVGPPGKIKTDSYPQSGFSAQMAVALAAIRRGDLDLVVDAPVPPDALRSFTSDPRLNDLVHQDFAMGVDYIAMNVAAPPFDDVHARKAFYLVIDRLSLQDAFQGLTEPVYGQIPNHIVPDAMEDALLISWRPGWVPADDSHDLRAAKAEMRRSGYDHDGDGACDSKVCRSVALISDDQWPKEFNAPVRASAASIGIRLTFRRFEKFDAYPKQDRPQHRWPLNANRWLPDYPNGSDFFPFLFDGATLDDPQTFNSSVLGATPQQLDRWGYQTKRVPSVDGRIDRCDALIGHPQVECWTSLDRYLMDEVVPWVPFLFEQTAQVVSPRVEHYKIDQFVGWPALDQIALRPESS
jgi:peptide/nickel transport system substrate-binding protein